MPTHDNHYALVVGIDHYPKFRPLNGARQDAQDFIGWLKDKNTGGGLPEKNIFEVLSENNPPRPIHEHIDDALENLLELADEGVGKRLYLYFSGHGLSRTNTATDLCLAKWSTRRKGLALDSEDYLSMLMGSGIFEEIVMILDCCRIRKVRSRALPPTIDFARPGDNASGSRSFVGYATEFLNAAHEAALEDEDVEIDATPIVRGHFTRALIDALEGGAADDTGGVTAERLKEYLEVHTPEIAKLANHIQKPEVVNGFTANPATRFGSASPPAKPPTVAVAVSFATANDRVFVLENGNLDIIKQAPSNSSDWQQLHLQRGNYALRAQDSDDIVNIRVTGHETEKINVTA